MDSWWTCDCTKKGLRPKSSNLSKIQWRDLSLTWSRLKWAVLGWTEWSCLTQNHPYLDAPSTSMIVSTLNLNNWVGFFGRNPKKELLRRKIKGLKAYCVAPKNLVGRDFNNLNYDDLKCKKTPSIWATDIKDTEYHPTNLSCAATGIHFIIWMGMYNIFYPG